MYDLSRQNSSTRSAGDVISATRMEDFNKDLDALFKRLDDRNLSLTYNGSGQLTQIVDNTNTITVNITWTDFGVFPYRLYIQEAGNPKKFTVQYTAGGYPSTIIYA